MLHTEDRRLIAEAIKASYEVYRARMGTSLSPAQVEDVWQKYRFGFLDGYFFYTNPDDWRPTEYSSYHQGWSDGSDLRNIAR